MTLQERILEALGERAVPCQAIYRTLKGDQPCEIDLALSALLKRGVITRELGHYQRCNGRVTAAQAPQQSTPVARKPPVAVPVEPQREAPTTAVARAPLAIEPKHKGRPAAQIITCKRCGEPKPRSEFTYPRKRVCHGCKRPSGRRRQPIIASGEISSEIVNGKIEAAHIESIMQPPPARKYTFSPTVTIWLIEEQRYTAELLQLAHGKVDQLQERLANLEELVRMATQKEGNY